MHAGERMYAHGGIVAAAAAILADMERHHLLPRLLEEYEPFSQQHQLPTGRSALLPSALISSASDLLPLCLSAIVFVSFAL